MWNALWQSWRYAKASNNTAKAIATPTSPSNRWLSSASLFEKAGAAAFIYSINPNPIIAAGAMTATSVFFGLASGCSYIGNRTAANHYNAVITYSKSYVCNSALKGAMSRGGSYSDAYNMAKNMYFGVFSGISKSEFFSILESNGLIDSYARTHPDAKINSANSYRGEIGGVAVNAGQIMHFSNLPAQSLFDELVLCLPFRPGTKQLPFTQNQLQQVMVELSRGILVEQTNPFFSLHFSREGKLYPIIHPAYHNTLVGDVIGMLDYYMKGYLNGGLYPEHFLREWHKTENMDKTYLLNNVIDLKKYAKQYHIDYISLRELMHFFELQDTHGSNEEKTNFRTSFRIIAAQGDIQSQDNILIGAPNTRVEYTIELMPHYKQYLAEFEAKQGTLPKEYQTLQQVYARMAEQIRTNMAMLPFCQGYFHLLDVISLFTYVIHSLKARGQLPQLNEHFTHQAFTFPTSLPPFPVRHYKFLPVQICIGNILDELDSLKRNEINSYIQRMGSEEGVLLYWENIEVILKPLFKKVLSGKISGGLIDEQLESRIFIATLNSLKYLVELSNKQCKKSTQFLDGLLKSNKTIQEMTENEITVQINTVIIANDSIDNQAKIAIDSLLKELRAVFSKIEIEQKKIEDILQGYYSSLANIEAKRVQEINKINQRIAPPGYIISSAARNAAIDSVNAWAAKIKKEFENKRSEFIREIVNASEGKTFIEDYQNRLKSQWVHLLNHMKKSLVDRQNRFLDVIDRNRILFDNSRIPVSTLDIADSQFMQVEGEDKKIIGGCGLDLTSVELSPIAYREFSQILSRKASSLLPNTLSQYTRQNIGYYFFKINTELHLSSEPYEYLKKPLFSVHCSPPNKMEENIISAITSSNSDCSKFLTTSAISSFHDETKRNFFHYWAMYGGSVIDQLFTPQLTPLLWNYDVKGYSPFHTAILAGHILLVKKMLSVAPALAHHQTLKRYTPLMLACLEGEVDIVTILIEHQANPNICLMDGSSALYMAVQKNHEKVALKILTLATQVNVNLALVNGQTILHEAIEINMDAVISKLISRGANLEAKREQDDFTPFHTAAYCGLDEVLKCMLTAASSQNRLIVNQIIASGETALHLAVRQGAFSAVEVLIAHHANADLANKKKEIPLFVAIKHGYSALAKFLLPRTNLALKDINNKSALILAAEHCDFELCDAIITRGFDLKGAELEKNSFMPFSYYLIIRGEYLRYKNYLIKGLINPTKEYGNYSALSLAAHCKSAKIYYLLANTLQKKEKNLSQSKLARFLSLEEQIMIDDVCALESESELPNLIKIKEFPFSLIHIAINRTSEQCLKYLIAQTDKKKLDKINQYEHILTAAVNTQNLKIIDLILPLIDNINDVIDEYANCIQHYAVRTGNLEVVKHLTERGACLDIVNNKKLSPLHFAIEADDHEMMKLILRLQKVEESLASLFAYSLEKNATRCITYLRKLITENSEQAEISKLFVIAIEKQDSRLIKQIESAGHPINRVDIETIIKQDNSGLFARMYSEHIINLYDVLRLIVKYYSFELIKYLQKSNSLKTEVINQVIQEHATLNKFVRLALLNRYETIKHEQEAILHAMDSDDLDGFKTLIAEYPINKLFFIFEEQAMPLLHVVVIKNKMSFLAILKDKGANLLLPDNKGKDIVSKIKIPDCSQFCILGHYFPQDLPQLLIKKNGKYSKAFNFIFSGEFNKKASAELRFFIKLRDNISRNIIHIAAEYNNFELLNLGIDYNVSVNSGDKKGITPLMIAASFGHDELIQKLLASGADPNKLDKEQKLPLHYAVLNKKAKTALILLPLTKKIKHQDRNGQNILIMATINNCSDLIPHLFKYELDINSRDRFGYSALHYAAIFEHISILCLLIQRGHEIDIEQQCISKPHKSHGSTPLHLAAQSKKIKSLLVLLHAGANISKKDKVGKNFFDHAVYVNDSMVNNIILETLNSTHKSRKAELLFTIAKSDNVDLLQRLSLSHDDIKKSRDDFGRTPLHIAIQAKKYNMVAQMLAIGVPPHEADINGDRPIHYAAALGEISFVRELTKNHQVGGEVKNSRGETPLHIAAKKGHLGCVIELVRSSKTNNYMAADAKNLTAAELALQHNHWETAEVLLLLLDGEDILQLTQRESFINIPLVQSNQFRLQQILDRVRSNMKNPNPNLITATELNNNYVRKILEFKEAAFSSVHACRKNWVSSRETFFTRRTSDSPKVTRAKDRSCNSSGP